MKTVLAVTGLELREKRFVFAAALLAGLLPFGLSLLPATPNWSPEERALIAVWIAAAFATALSIILGASHLAKETADGRLRFYFARPLSSWGLWLGRVSSAIILVVLSAIVVTLPSLAAARFVLKLEPRWLLLGLGTFPLLLLAHGVSLAIRSRSAWSLVMLAAGVVAAWAVWICVRDLRRMEMYGGIARPAAVFFASAATLALAVAGLLSIQRGRGDLRASFFEFARVFVIAAIGLGVIALGTVAWYRSVRPEDVEGFSTVVAAPDGDHLFVSGPVASRPRLLASFLTDSVGQRAEFVRWVPWLSPVPLFSADGHLAAWLDSSPRWLRSPWAGVPTLQLRRLDGASFARAITLHDAPDALAISTSGDHVALTFASLVNSRVGIEIYDTSSARRLCAFASPGDLDLITVRFVNSDRLRLIGWAYEPVFMGSQAHLRVFDFFVSKKKLQLQSTIPFPSHLIRLVRFDNTRRHALFLEPGVSPTAPARGAWLVDLDSGVGLAHFENFTNIDFLFDGRIAEAEVTLGHSSLRLNTIGGELEKIFPLPPARAIRIGPEIGDNRLLLLVVKADGKTSDVLSLALDSAEVRTLGHSLTPISAFQPWLDIDRELSKPGSPGTHLFLDKHFALIRLDPKTGEQRVILGKSAR